MPVISMFYGIVITMLFFDSKQHNKYFQKIKLGQGTVTWPHEQDMSTIRLYLEGK